jgi:predicted NACHT family NTPase
MLPLDFLREIAENYELTEKEQEVFLEKFGSNKSEQATVDKLHLSDSAIRNRLSGVYRKFSISASGPVKSDQLFRFLTKEYQKSHPILLAESLVEESDIDALVQKVREKVRLDIQKRCGSMRVLDMTHPIGLSDIYTDVNIFEKIIGSRRLEIAQLLETCNLEDFDRFGLGRVTEERVPGLVAVKRYSKLMILGKPGAGKTTFLKRVATQCNKGQFFGERVPIFITLKDFAETTGQPGLLQYITTWFVENQILDQQAAEMLLRQGRAIVLLDGLDEVKQADNNRVLKEIRDFSNRYDANYLVITCRIAAKEYTFEQFTEVEVADFDDPQIAEFATKWFQAKDPEKAKQFIQKLKENQRIKELATNPLLLTLLCLLFGESTDFPSNRSELYEEGLDVLLRKWDGTRRIERDQSYRKLPLKRKEDLLGQIALATFEQGSYFFKQRLAERYITDYIQNLPNAQTDLEALELDSRAVLKSIEAQHGLLVERARGIYSFSHLTFHEFFTARNIAYSRNSQQAFQQLVCHMKDKHWREVFLLAVGILPNADDLVRLMKQQVDALLATDEKLQQFLVWGNEKSRSIEAPYKLAAVRAFYLASALDRDRDLASALDRDRDLARALDLDRARALDLALARNLDLDLALDRARALGNASISALDRDRALGTAVTRALDLARYHISGLQQKLQLLKEQLPDISQENLGNFGSWWQASGQTWIEQLRVIMIQYRNIGHDWQFSNSQIELLQQYYNANKLLIDCLNSDCYVSREVRQEIEDTLLLPLTEIENRTK